MKNIILDFLYTAIGLMVLFGVAVVVALNIGTHLGS